MNHVVSVKPVFVAVCDTCNDDLFHGTYFDDEADAQVAAFEHAESHPVAAAAPQLRDAVSLERVECSAGGDFDGSLSLSGSGVRGSVCADESRDFLAGASIREDEGSGESFGLTAAPTSPAAFSSGTANDAETQAVLDACDIEPIEHEFDCE